MATRSGRPYRPSQPVQVSVWALELETVSKVLQTYFDLETLLKARTICQAWRQIWGSSVPGLMLEQPQSVAAARKLGRRAVAALPAVSKARIRLYRSSVEAVLDFTSCEETAVAELPVQSERAAAASAMLRQLQQLKHLRSLHLATRGCFSNALPQLIPHLPAGQLRVLDLTEVPHDSSVLPVIAAHLTHLEKLVMGRIVPCSCEDMAALSSLVTLQELTCEVQPTCQQGRGFGALTQVTKLKLALDRQVVDGRSAAARSNAAIEATVAQLTGMASLQELEVIFKCVNRGNWYWYDTFGGKDTPYSGDHGWGRALSGMKQLQHLRVHGYKFSDSFLQAVSLQRPRHLVLGFGDGVGDMACISSIGAQAVSHVPQIEVHALKVMDACCKAFTSMPNVRCFFESWWQIHGRRRCLDDGTVCTCDSCWPQGTHCKKDNGATCCGRCRGLKCSCT